MIEENNCINTELIICPFCGHEHIDSWEQTKSGEFECEGCEKLFFVSVQVETTYTSFEILKKECLM